MSRRGQDGPMAHPVRTPQSVPLSSCNYMPSVGFACPRRRAELSATASMTGLLWHNQSVDEPTKPSLSLPSDPSEVVLAPSSNADFPDALRRIKRPVSALWYRGRLPDPPAPALAIVGARAASRSG